MQPALQLALLVAILLPVGKLGASLCTRFGIPAILGELFIGVLLGPGAINLLHLRLFHGELASGSLMLVSVQAGRNLSPRFASHLRSVMPSFVAENLSRSVPAWTRIGSDN